MIPGNSRTAAGFWQLGAFAALVLLQSSAAASDFRFDRDTVGFANATVFEYREGHPYLRRQREKGEPKRYTRRCFVLCRTTMHWPLVFEMSPAGRLGKSHCRQISASSSRAMPTFAQ